MNKIIVTIFTLILSALACNFQTGVDVDTRPETTEAFPPAQQATIFPTRPPAERVDDKWKLWVGGTRLRGANLHPCSLFDDDGNCIKQTTRQDVQDLRDNGANMVNASYPGVYTVYPPYEVAPNSLAYLDNLIHWADEIGLYVVIHFRTGPGRNEASIHMYDDALFDVWTDPEAQKAWAAMWQFTAERYRNSPVVVGYDLMVEPHPNVLIDPDSELEPDEAQAQLEGTLLDWNNLAAEITAAIRQVDPDTPIIINSLDWASAQWFSVLQPTGDTRTVYSLHDYDPDIYTTQEDGETATSYPDTVNNYGETIVFDRSWLEENLQPAVDFSQANHVPIYVGEFGLMRWVPDAVVFLNDKIDLYERYGWNYAYYVWRGDDEYFDGFNLEFGPDPDNHQILPGNPIFGVFQERWVQNRDFPPR